LNQQTTPYREDTYKKDQGWAFFDRGSAYLALDDDGPAIMTVTTLAANEDDGTYKTPRPKTLGPRESTSAMLKSLEKGRSGYLSPMYSHIWIYRHNSNWIRWLKNVRRRCTLVKPSCCTR
jgi:hypothetical protein